MIASSSNLLRLNTIWLTFPPAFEWPRRDLGTVVQDLMARTLPPGQWFGCPPLFLPCFSICTARCPPAHSSVARKKEEARTREPSRRASSTEAAQGHAPPTLVRVSLFVARRRSWRPISEPARAALVLLFNAFFVPGDPRLGGFRRIKAATVAGQLSGWRSRRQKRRSVALRLGRPPRRIDPFLPLPEPMPS